jgi:CxxC motif-containing protein (DUF1111 family)
VCLAFLLVWLLVGCARGGEDAGEATAVHGGLLEGGPKIEPDDFLKVVLYSSLLAVPARRGWDEPQVLGGKMIFNEIGCTGCLLIDLGMNLVDAAVDWRPKSYILNQ